MELKTIAFFMNPYSNLIEYQILKKLFAVKKLQTA